MQCCKETTGAFCKHNMKLQVFSSHCVVPVSEAPSPSPTRINNHSKRVVIHWNSYCFSHWSMYTSMCSIAGSSSSALERHTFASFVCHRAWRCIYMSQPAQVYISPHCEMITGIFGLLLGPMGTFSIFRMTSKPSRIRPAPRIQKLVLHCKEGHLFVLTKHNMFPI